MLGIPVFFVFVVFFAAVAAVVLDVVLCECWGGVV
jgi:hypothetical protein